jgi:hypothetical protein
MSYAIFAGKGGMPVHAQKIEVTPEMIKAAEQFYPGWEECWNDAYLASVLTKIYQAMAAVDQMYGRGSDFTVDPRTNRQE